MSKQPRDDGNDPIPVLGFKQHGGKIVPFESASANTSPAIANSIRVITLYSTKDAFLRLVIPELRLIKLTLTLFLQEFLMTSRLVLRPKPLIMIDIFQLSGQQKMEWPI